jgi:hypothetical protein
MNVTPPVAQLSMGVTLRGRDNAGATLRSPRASGPNRSSAFARGKAAWQVKQSWEAAFLNLRESTR